MKKTLINTITIIFFVISVPIMYYACYKFIKQSIDTQKRIEQSHHEFDLTRCKNNGGFHHKQHTGKYGFMVYVCNDGIILYDVDGYPPTAHNYSD